MGVQMRQTGTRVAADPSVGRAEELSAAAKMGRRAGEGGLAAGGRVEEQLNLYSSIGRPIRADEKPISERTKRAMTISRPPFGKLSARRIQICCVYFCKIHVWSQNTFPNNNRSKIDTVDFHLPCQILVC